MANTSFDDLVRQEQQAASTGKIDRAKERDAWLKRLDDLFLQVDGYLDEYVQTGAVQILKGNVELNEEQIGSYRAPQMTVTIGSKAVRLEPVGTFIIGARGRVDVVGPQGRSARLMLMDSEVKRVSDLIKVSVFTGPPPPPPPPKDPSTIHWVWRIMKRAPQMEIIEVNKETFLNLLAEIANG
jgi:hypothetical protein